MVTRHNLFRKFGPLVIEAFMLMTIKAINDLRVKAGLTPYTKDQIMAEIENHLSTLTPYDWMK